MTVKNAELSEALSIATSIAYTKKQIGAVREEIAKLKQQKELVVEYVQGPSGKEGPRGFMGAKGDTGDKGDKGDKGDQGERGYNGVEGPQGLRGEKGDKGDRGDTGEKGDTGAKGDIGPKGDRGDTGERGLQGIAGKNGVQGAKGDTGERGTKGDKGERGEAGRDGIDGQAGPKGDRGDKGPKGDKGDKGDAGEKGDTGDRGERGERGEQGLSYNVAELESKIKSYEDSLAKDLQEYKQKINQAVSKSIGSYKSAGGGEVNLRFLDDVDTSNLANGRILSYDAALKKFVFVAGVDSEVANTALEVAQAAYDAANNSSLTIRNEGFDLGSANIVNFVGDAVTTTVANGIATVTVSGTGEGGGPATSNSLNVIFQNNTAVPYRVVALDSSAQTVLASATNITQVDKILGVLDADGETVTSGLITNPAWNWTAEQSLFLGANGNIVITSTVDAASFSLKVGYAVSPTIMFVKIGTPVIL
jgi:Collagen triple helix repeat (20 copies)